MKSNTLRMYDALVDAGIKKENAREIADSIISKDELRAHATIADIKDMEIRFYKALATQTVVLVGAVITLVQLLS